MHNDVVGDVGWEKYELVVEIQISFLRAAPPARLVILDEYLLYRNVIERIEMPDAIVNKHARFFAHF